MTSSAGRKGDVRQPIGHSLARDLSPRDQVTSSQVDFAARCPSRHYRLKNHGRQREGVVRESQTEFFGEVSCRTLEVRVEVTSRFEITCFAHPVIGDAHAVDQSLET